ncbi:glycosyltransferase [Bacillus sp. MCCB 382]|uniref:glycosyltransferase family 2 protein n=1 Tax=Bacillus sp. MCCB 382 TaxID=2860197 RepID=UPI001C582C85|nr:glycosyltransferase [Bacillus sp. MCCB 382]
MNELITVIMSSYNEELNWVEESMQSILNQTYENIELIVVLDNPDHDELRELLSNHEQTDSRVKVLINEKNLGLVSSLNRALEHCRGHYIARMDADDRSLPNRLELQKKYLENNHFDFVFSEMILMDEKGNILVDEEGLELAGDEIKRRLKYTNVSTHPTWFLKREVYEMLNGYREVPYCEDYDFILRAVSRNVKIGKMKENVLKYRLRDNSISKRYMLEQFMISRQLVSLYKENKLEDFSKMASTITKWTDSNAHDAERVKYVQARDTFHEAVGLIQNRRYGRGMNKLMRSMFVSRYFILRSFDGVKAYVSRGR